MSTLWVMRGIPASGKTTEALRMMSEDPKLVRSNRDLLREMMFGGWTGKYNDESLVTAQQYAGIRAALKAGRDVVCDDTNLSRKTVRGLWDLSKTSGSEFFLLDEFMSVPLADLLLRNVERGRPVPDDVIREKHAKFANQELDLSFMHEVELTQGELYVPTIGAPDCYLIDIDGTVALHHNVRGPFETDKYHLDEPNWPVIRTIQRAALGHHELTGERPEMIFLSGRHVDFFDVTAEWLREVIPFGWTTLIMRDDDRQRPQRDNVIKRSLFDRYIRNEYNVLGVFDDRNRVVDMWRSLGLTVFQVADGDF